MTKCVACQCPGRCSDVLEHRRQISTFCRAHQDAALERLGELVRELACVSGTQITIQAYAGRSRVALGFGFGGPG